MPKKEEFVLKDSDPEFIKAAGVQPRGREYDASCAKKAGAIRIDEVLLGTKLACMSLAVSATSSTYAVISTNRKC